MAASSPLLFLALALTAGACAHQVRPNSGGRLASTAGAAPVRATVADPEVEQLPRLRVDELLAPGAALAPSARAVSLSGQRVRLVGFVAQMELKPEGALYLVPRPVHCDEAGAGTADLPPDAVLVMLPATWREPESSIEGAVEAVGRFEVGNQSEGPGAGANFRLQLELPKAGHSL